MKHNQKGIAHILLLVAIAVVLSGAGVVTYSRIQDASQKDDATSASSNEVDNSEQNNTNSSNENDDSNQKDETSPVTVKGQVIVEGEVYEVAIGEADYYGQVQKISDDFFKLSPVYYIENGVSAQTAITVLGNELHGPQPAMYIAQKHVSAVRELKENDVKHDAVRKLAANGKVHNDAYPSSKLDDYLADDLLQGVFLKNDKAFFGKVESFGGKLSFKGNVYYLRSESGSTGGTGGTTAQLSLALAQPSEYESYMLEDVRFWENLKADGQISQAVLQYESQL